MEFEKILPKARKGHKITRRGWGRKAYIKFRPFLEGGGGEFLTPFGNLINLNRAICEDDWEVCPIEENDDDQD